MARSKKVLAINVSNEPYCRQGKDGRFYYEIDKILDDGTRWRKAGSARTAAEIISKRDAALNLLSKGQSPKQWTLQSWAEHCVAQIWPGDLDLITLDHYEADLRNHVHPILGSRLLTKLSTDEIRNLIKAMELAGTDKHLRANVRNVISKLYTTAAAERVYNGPNPAKPIRVSRQFNPSHNDHEDLTSHKRTLTDGEQAALLDSVRNHWAYGIILVGLRMGLRMGEILAMSYDNVDWDRKMYRVSFSLGRIPSKYRKVGQARLQVKSPKKNKTRFVPIHPEVMAYLKDHVDSRQGKYVFARADGAFVAPESLAAAMQVITKNAGLRGQKDQWGNPLADPTMHDLRHTFGHWGSRKTNARTLQLIMGHSSITTTLQYYTDSQFDELAAAMEQMSA